MPAVSGVPFTTIARPREGVLLLEVPAAVVRKLGDRQRPPVRVDLNGVEYRSTIAAYGGRYYLPARKEIRDAANLEAGKRARVTLALDTAERTVAVPRDLAAALAKEGAMDAFAAMSFSHRREHVRWVEDAKRPQTRSPRIAKVVTDAVARSRAPLSRGSRSSGRGAPRGSR